MGSVIGKAGSKIKEIQEASGARLQASEAMLPGSTERVLSVSGVADAIHIAVYYIGTILMEGPQIGQTTNTSYRPTSNSYHQVGDYGPPQRGGPPGGGAPYGGGPQGGPGPRGPPPPQPGPGAQTQQIFIPNELVGSIIGKAGAKINEVRQTSQCQIKINEPGDAAGGNPQERVSRAQHESWPFGGRVANMEAVCTAGDDHGPAEWDPGGRADAVPAPRGGEAQA